MKLDVKIQLLNFCFQVFNFIFLTLGLSVFCFGFWILFDGGNLLTLLISAELRTVGAGLLLIGLVALAASVVGLLGAVRDNRVLLFVYLVCLIILVLGQLFVTLLLLITRDKIKRSLDETVDQIILKYSNNKSEDRLMDKIQNYEGCCGRMSPADWLENSYIQTLNLTEPDVLPCSCFRRYRPAGDSPWCSKLLDFTAPMFGRGNGSYDQGCETKVSDWLDENTLTIVGIDVTLMLIQVSLFVLTVYLYRDLSRRAALKRKICPDDPEHDLDDPEHDLNDPEHDVNDPEHDLDNPEHDLANGEQNYAYIDPTYPAHHHNYPVDPTRLYYHHDNQNYN